MEFPVREYIHPTLSNNPALRGHNQSITNWNPYSLFLLFYFFYFLFCLILFVSYLRLLIPGEMNDQMICTHNFTLLLLLYTPHSRIYSRHTHIYNGGLCTRRCATRSRRRLNQDLTGGVPFLFSPARSLLLQKNDCDGTWRRWYTQQQLDPGDWCASLYSAILYPPFFL